jgi:hypothetical protein
MECVSVSTGSDLKDLDMRMLEFAKTEGWTNIAKAYQKTGKEFVIKSTHAEWNASAAMALEFLGAYRKIMIAYLFAQYVKALDGSRRAQSAYKRFLGSTKFSECIRFAALGSTNATSDYDVTLCGPGAPCILSHIVSACRDLAQETTSFLFDSNFYIGPDILVKRDDKNKNKFAGITLYFPESTSTTYNVAVPVPDKDIFALERKCILEKLDQADDRTIVEKYDRLVQLGKELDKMVYSSKKNVNKLALFTLLFDIKKTSIEAYYGVSTVLVVVHGMQSNKLAEVAKKLQKENFQNACLENVIDFTAHWNEYASDQKRNADEDQRVFIKLSKYILRVLVCLEHLDTRISALRHKQEIERIVANRAAVKVEENVHLAKYGIPNEGKIELNKNLTGVLHEAYKVALQQRS